MVYLHGIGNEEGGTDVFGAVGDGKIADLYNRPLPSHASYMLSKFTQE